MPKVKTDWIRAAVSGATIDGREIPERALQDVAAAYSQDVYNARVWPEHIRSTAPGGVFKPLGDVTDVKVKRVEGGALDGRQALYVKIEPAPELVAMVRAGEKIHLSIEIEERFADTGGAYLVGLGVTDSPASLGTGMMKFNTQKRTENLFSSLLPAEIVEPYKSKDKGKSTSKASAAQFAQVQADLKDLKQSFKSEFERLFSKLSEIETKSKQDGETLAKTWECVEEIGSFSAGRFKRGPATGGRYESKVDY